MRVFVGTLVLAAAGIAGCTNYNDCGPETVRQVTAIGKPDAGLDGCVIGCLEYLSNTDSTHDHVVSACSASRQDDGYVRYECTAGVACQ